MNSINRTVSPITDCKPGTRVVIKSIAAGPGAIKNLTDLGLHMGNTVTVKQISRLGGPVLIESSGSEIAIGRRLAKKILVGAPD
jgi:Fe2+ transport system protein FeoA